MKRFFAALGVCSVLAVASNAAAVEWSAGLLGGVNFADLTDVDETSMKAGFSGGGFVTAQFKPGTGVRVEVLYTQKGTSRNTNPEFGDQDSTVKLDYVDVPVLLVGTLNKTETRAFNIFGGPSFNYNMSAEDEAEDGTIQDLSDDVETLEVGLVVGAEFEHIRESLSVFFDLRVSIGLTGVLENAASEYDGVKNIGLGALVGLEFPIGGK